MRNKQHMFEAPHAELHDAHDNTLLVDMFQEKEGEVRPDHKRHDWIQYLGELLNGKEVIDFYGQRFQLDNEDIIEIEDELVENYELFKNLIKLEIRHDPIKATYLPVRFLDKLYSY